MNPADTPPESPVRLVFGAHRLQELGTLVQEINATRALVITDAGVVNAGHLETALSTLSSSNISTVSFSHVEENPSTDTVERAADFAAEKGIEVIIGLGGGSAMDTAKGCNLLLTQTGAFRQYVGVGKLISPTLPMICIPTTAGTGSEVQSAALISDSQTHQKLVIIDPKLRPSTAILDPTLSLSQPQVVTEAAGLDALGHAIESAVSRNRTEMSWRYSVEAFRLGFKAFARVLEAPNDLPARASMLLAASYAGLAIEESMLGAAHACANPLTQNYGFRHGFAVGVALPTVIRFNAKSCAQQYAALARSAGISEANNDADAAHALSDALHATLCATTAPQAWHEIGASTPQIVDLASAAAAQRTASFNPRNADQADFEQLYTSICTALEACPR